MQLNHIMKKKDIKILLVDDEKDILEIVGYNLSQEGYQISTASTTVLNKSKAMKKSTRRAVTFHLACPKIL